MSLKKRAVTGIKWSAVNDFSRRILSLISNIILARLLLPSDFGLVAMAAVALGLIELLRDIGTGSAIIQRKEVSQDLLSSVFWMNVVLGLSTMLLLVALAPLISYLYDEPRILPILQALSLGIFITSLSIVQSSLMQRALAFEMLAKIGIISALLTVITAISMAYAGAGVWSLVWRGIVGSLLNLILLWTFSSWRPGWVFHWQDLKSVMGYSLNLSASNVIYYLSRNIDNLLIGRFLGAEQLGYYNLAYQLMLYPLQGVSAVVGKVMFPLYSKIQDDNGQFRKVFLLSAASIALITFPLMFGLMAIREPLVFVLFGPRWEPVIILLAFFAPIGAMQSIGTSVSDIYQAKGRTDMLLRWTLFATAIVVVAIVLGLQWGIVGVAISYTAASLLLMYPTFAIPFRIIDLSVWSLLKALKLPLLSTLIMSLIVVLLGLVIKPIFSNLMQVAILIPVGVLCYTTSLWLIDREHVQLIIRTLRGK